VIAVLSHPGIGPLEGLARALAEAFQCSAADGLGVLTQNSAGLSDFAGRVLCPGEQLMVVVDQFEELFRYRWQTGDRGRVESTAFVKLLLTATGNSDVAPRFPDPRVYAVLTMRSDYIGKCSQFRGLPEALNDAQYLVPRLTRDQQREAIEGPIALAGAQITDWLVERILNDAGDDPDQLPVLQHALLRVWEAADLRARNEALDLPHYEDSAVGGIADALNRDAENAYGRLKSSAEEAIARRMFQRLVEPGTEDEETRRPTLLSEIVSVCGAPESDVRAVIEVFRERGFLTLTSAFPETVDLLVDTSHESLIRQWNRLKSWVEEEERSAAIYSRLAESALNCRTLYRGPDLAEAVRWEREESPNQHWASRYNSDLEAWESAIKFLRRSKMYQKLVPAGYGLLFAAVVPVAVFFWLGVGNSALSVISTTSVIAILSVLSLVAGPALVVLALCFYRLRPQTQLMPLVIPVIPLAMTSVSIYLIAFCLAMTKGFEDLAAATSSDSAFIVRVLLQNRHSLLLRLTEIGICILFALLFQLTRRAPATKDRQLPALSRSSVFVTAATVLAICLTVSLSRDIVGLLGPFNRILFKRDSGLC
jgi:hypothetical protein